MPTNWETTDTLKVPLDITWQFDYKIEIEKLRNLYSKSKRAQWDAEVDIDWSQPIDPSRPLIDEERVGSFAQLPLFKKLSDSQRETLRAHVTARNLSGILHGEQGALMTSAVLTHSVPDYEGKLYAAQQTADEARHVEVYQRYIDRIAVIYPMGQGLKLLIEKAFKGDHWVKVAIGMNMVVESLALGAFHNMRRATTCPTLRKLLELVLRDESRHVAFGYVYVADAIGAMHPDEREDIAEFAYECIAPAQGGDGSRRTPGQLEPQFAELLKNTGIDPEDWKKEMRDRPHGQREPEPGEVHMFKDLIMPALARVGAITDRTREKFKEVGVEVYEDTTVLESMEDADTGSIEF